MRTIKNINDELQLLYNNDRSNSVYYNADDKSESKRISDRITFLRHCKIYLESVSPSEETVRAELAKTETLLKSKNAQYKQWLSKQNWSIKNPEAKYRSLMNLPIIEAQIETLKFILSDVPIF